MHKQVIECILGSVECNTEVAIETKPSGWQSFCYFKQRDVEQLKENSKHKIL